MRKPTEFTLEAKEVEQLREAALTKSAYVELITTMETPNEFVEKRFIKAVGDFNKMGEDLILKYTGCSMNNSNIKNWSCDYSSCKFTVTY